jgi:adenosine deaminase
MTTDADKELLIKQYAAAVAEERSTWHLWQDPGLNEAERARAYARWKDAAERMRTLALHLTAGPSEPPPSGNVE